MSDSFSAAPAAASRSRPAATPRAARRNKAEREIRLLHGGVSIAGVAALEAEMHMRARLQESLARSPPEPPAEALALLGCDGVMAKANLEAIDRVVEIAREFDRTRGFTTAGCSHGAETLDLAAPAQNPLALPAPPFGRPKMLLQALEKPRFAPGNGSPFFAPAKTSQPRAGRSHSALTGRPEMLPQAIENAQTTPGNGLLFALAEGEPASKPKPSRSPLTGRPEMP